MLQTSEIITNSIAVYGAITGTISLLLSVILGIHELKKSKAKIKVKISMGRLVDSNLMKSSEPVIIIEAQNTGFTKVILMSFGWLEKDGTKHQPLNLYNIVLPYSVEPHRKAQIIYACRWFRNDSNKSKFSAAYFEDEEGNLWKMPISKKQKHFWENASTDGFFIEWNKELRTFYHKEQQSSL